MAQAFEDIPANPYKPIQLPNGFVDRLLARKDWDKALLMIRNRQPMGIIAEYAEISLEQTVDGPVLKIVGRESPDPFYDQRVDGKQPRVCTHTTTVRLLDVVTIEYIEYPKIVSMDSKIIVP